MKDCDRKIIEAAPSGGNTVGLGFKGLKKCTTVGQLVNKIMQDPAHGVPPQFLRPRQVES